MDDPQSPATQKINVMGASRRTTSQKEQYPFIKVDPRHNDPLIMIHAQPTTSALSAGKTQQIEGRRSQHRNIYVKAVVKFKLETVEETTARQARQEPVAIKYQKNRLRKRFHLYVLLQVILQDHHQMIKNSVEHLTSLLAQSQLQFLARKELSKESISKYLTQANYKCKAVLFIKQLSELLDIHFAKISQELQKSLNLTQMNANVEVISILLRTILYFQEYIPEDDYSCNVNSWHIKLQLFYTLFKLTKKQFEFLKKLFLENYSTIIYLPAVPNIDEFILAYYLFQLKKRLIPSNLGKFRQYQRFMDEFRQRKHEANLRKMNRIEERILFSQLFDRKRPKIKSVRKIQPNALIQILQVFSIIENLKQKDKAQKHMLMRQLSNKYELNLNNLRIKLKRYIVNLSLLKEKYGNDLSELKDELMIKHLTKDPYCRYEEVFKNVYHNYHVYIEQDYFEGNVRRLLAKVTQHQQRRYLEKVFRGADLRKEKVTVLFVDCCNLTNTLDNKIVITVTLTGKLFCCKFRGVLHILEDVKLFLEDSKPSIVLLFDEQFHEKELPYLGLYHFRKHHTLLLLPHAPLVPNPCMTIVNSLGAALSAKLKQLCDQGELFQALMEEFEPRVKEIVEKEWEKIQIFVHPGNVDQIRSEEMSQKHIADSSVEEESEYDSDKYSNAMDEKKSQHMRVPRYLGNVRGKEGVSLNSPHLFQQHPIIENLQDLSASTLRCALIRLLKLNIRDLFQKKSFELTVMNRDQFI